MRTLLKYAKCGGNRMYVRHLSDGDRFGKPARLGVIRHFGSVNGLPVSAPSHDRARPALTTADTRRRRFATVMSCLLMHRLRLQPAV